MNLQIRFWQGNNPAWNRACNHKSSFLALWNMSDKLINDSVLMIFGLKLQQNKTKMNCWTERCNCLLFQGILFEVAKTNNLFTALQMQGRNRLFACTWYYYLQSRTKFFRQDWIQCSFSQVLLEKQPNTTTTNWSTSKKRNGRNLLLTDIDLIVNENHNRFRLLCWKIHFKYKKWIIWRMLFCCLQMQQPWPLPWFQLVLRLRLWHWDL